MKSRAHFQGHPLHPALIPFPFAFLVGALLFDTIGLLQRREALNWTGGHLSIAGLAAGLIAAIPGGIDYFVTVPPASTGRRRATRHAILNITALALFAAAWLLRDDAWKPMPAAIACETLGAAALVYAGWLGGTLVTRNMISVDHRYAAAGKWQEATLAAKPSEPLVVGHVDDLQDDQMKLLRVNGNRIVLARTNGHYVAFDDRCTHRGGSLAGGVVIKGTVQCLWHGSQFDVRTGVVTSGPAKNGIRVYEVKQMQNGQLVLASPPE